MKIDQIFPLILFISMIFGVPTFVRCFIFKQHSVPAQHASTTSFYLILPTNLRMESSTIGNENSFELLSQHGIKKKNSGKSSLYFDENYINDHNDFFLSHLSTSYERVLVIILVGIPGSGKSTIARAISSSSRSDNRTWEVVNQDTLKSRKEVLIRARLALERKKSVIIDRCNIDYTQRQHWISLAREHNAHPVCVIVPNCLNIAACASRATLRGDDGVHSADTNWLQVCRRMERAFQRPELAEGLDAIYCCEGQEDGVGKLMTMMADL